MSALRWGMVATLGVGVVCLGITSSEASLSVTDPGPRAVRLATVAPAPEHRTVRLLGITRAAEQGALSFNQPGRVAARLVDIGDVVQAGQPLARLEGAPWRHGVRAAQASVTELETRSGQVARDRARLESLGSTGSVTEAELERIRAEDQALAANLDAALAQLADARRQRTDSVLVAPWEGVVTAAPVTAGQTVAAGTPVVVLSGRSHAEIHLEVPESLWATLPPDAPVLVTLPALGESVDARVSAVSDAALGGLFPVVIELGPIPAGLTAEVDLQLPEPPGGVSLPVGAVMDPTGTATSVFRVEPDGDALVARRVSVVPSVLHDGAVIVEGALSPGDRVVVAGHVSLLDGDRVSDSAVSR